MNKKTLQRVLCFLLALVVLVSMPLDFQAKAVAVELGWVTWALVSYLAACGFTFAVTGGIQALQNEVEDQVDEYYKVTGIDLFQLIAQSLRLKPSGNGNGNGFWFGLAAVSAITEFVIWLQENSWSNGSTNSYVVYSFPVYFYKNFVADYFTSGITINSDGTINNLMVNSSIDEIMSSSEQVYQYNIDGNYLSVTKTSIGYEYHVSSYLGWTESTAKTFQTDRENLRWTLAIPYDNPTINQYRSVYMILLDGNEIVDYYIKRLYVPKISEDDSISTVTSPNEFVEPEVQQNQVFEIDFTVFENEATFSDPEQLAEAVKQQIIDTGTTPEIKTDVKTEPQPTPEPTPAPPSYDDVDDLGLPSLGDALLDKFPFCLPSDIGRIMDIFTAERVTPYWEIDLYQTLGDRVPFRGDTAFAIDLAEYEELGAISRWTATIGYCLFLLLITRQMITW